jgi:AraC-like DNA-binding protein
MNHLIRSTAMLGFLEVFSHSGGDAREIASRFDINLDLANLDNEFVLMDNFVKMLEYAARAKNMPFLGLGMSPYHDISVLGPLSLVISNLPTVREAVNYAANHIDVMSPAIEIETFPERPIVQRSSSNTWICISINLGKPLVHTQTLDICLGNLHRFVKILAGENYQLTKVTVPHGTKTRHEAYSRFFEAPIEFEGDHAALLLSDATLDTRLDKPNKELSHIVDLHIQTNFRSLRGTYSARTAQVIKKVLGKAVCNKNEVADLLAIHPRTLQRHLSDEGTSFEQIKTQIVSQEALRYLTETAIPMTHLASMLGFSEQATLVRFCKRHFGRSPLAIRRNPPPHIEMKTNP